MIQHIMCLSPPRNVARSSELLDQFHHGFRNARGRQHERFHDISGLISGIVWYLSYERVLSATPSCVCSFRSLRSRQFVHNSSCSRSRTEARLGKLKTIKKLNSKFEEQGAIPTPSLKRKENFGKKKKKKTHASLSQPLKAIFSSIRRKTRRGEGKSSGPYCLPWKCCMNWIACSMG